MKYTSRVWGDRFILFSVECIVCTYFIIVHISYLVFFFLCFIHKDTLQARENRSEEPTEEELPEAIPKASVSDPHVQMNISQTDESKAAEQQNSFHPQQTVINKPRVPCLADTGDY